MLSILSNKQLFRVYRRLCLRACDQLGGVSSFDMPTLNACVPSLAEAIRTVKTEGARRRVLNENAGERV